MKLLKVLNFSKINIIIYIVNYKDINYIRTYNIDKEKNTWETTTPSMVYVDYKILENKFKSLIRIKKLKKILVDNY